MKRIALGTALLGAGLALSPGPLGAQLASRGPGSYRELAVLPSGDTLRYTLYVPRGIEGGEPVPLVLAAHFGGRVTPWMGGDFAELLVLPALSNFVSVIVAPDAVGPRGWSAADEDRVLWLMDRVREAYPIDEQRILMTGFSAGGAFTWSFANGHQDLFTAVIPMAASTRGATAPWTVPVHAIHSTADEVVPIGPVQAYVAAQRAAGGPVELHVVEGIPHHRTTEFAGPLREALVWLERVWGSGR